MRRALRSRLTGALLTLALLGAGCAGNASAASSTTILALADVNGDGRPHELVLYLKLSCAVVLTTLIGYSEARDQVIQYPVKLTIEKGKKTWSETVTWVISLFAETPVSPGHWTYELDFTGRGGCVNHYEVEYQPSQEAFAGREVLAECPDKSSGWPARWAGAYQSWQR